MNFKVSIITPVYNAERFLKETADSVFKQSYTDWEWILVNDCSTDKSWELMQGLSEKDQRIKIFSNKENIKSGKTRNFAIQKACGRFIAFLDADDKWHQDKLAIQISFMLENDYHFTHTSFGYLDEKGKKIKSTFHVSGTVDYDHLLKRTEIGCLTAVYDAGKIGKYYMSEHATKQDYALWLSILKTGVKSYGIDKELAFYRLVANSATSSKHKLILKHISFLKDTQGFNTMKAIYYTGYWMVNGFVRYFIK